VKYYDAATHIWYTAWCKSGGPGEDGWKGSLTDIEPDKGYWVIIKSGHPAVILTMVGEASNTHRVIPIQPGRSYNYVGTCFAVVCSLDGKTGDDTGLLASGFTGSNIAGLSDMIYYFDGTLWHTAWYKSAVPPPGPLGWKGTLHALEPGNGYILKVETGHAFISNQWVYPVPPDYREDPKAVSSKGTGISVKREFSSDMSRSRGVSTNRRIK
jgi:hypothetical protein